MAREIPLTKGFVTIVDDEDFDWLSQWKWFCALTGQGHPAAARNVKTETGRRLQYMHRLIMSPPTGLVVDHISGVELDNRRANLRICTARQNVCNSRKKSQTKPYKGVFKSVAAGRYYALICSNNEYFRLGTYETPEDAARAYDAAAREHFGDFARLNFPEPSYD